MSECVSECVSERASERVSEAAAGVEHAARDLAAVGDENFLEHGCRGLTARLAPGSTASPGLRS